MLAIDFHPLPQSPRRAFVVMPYGKKKDPRVNRFLDCDPAFHRVYRPLLEDFDVEWIRADLQTDSGIIHSAMLSDLANSDLVVADLSAINFNVAYELGIRHVFASRSTVLIDPSVTSFKRMAPPFDRQHDPYAHVLSRPGRRHRRAGRESDPRVAKVVATALAAGEERQPVPRMVRPRTHRAAIPAEVGRAAVPTGWKDRQGPSGSSDAICGP